MMAGQNLNNVAFTEIVRNVASGDRRPYFKIIGKEAPIPSAKTVCGVPVDPY
jgi:hypothetical protein